MSSFRLQRLQEGGLPSIPSISEGSAPAETTAAFWRLEGGGGGLEEWLGAMSEGKISHPDLIAYFLWTAHFSSIRQQGRSLEPGGARIE